MHLIEPLFDANPIIGVAGETTLTFPSRSFSNLSLIPL